MPGAPISAMINLSDLYRTYTVVNDEPASHTMKA